MTEFNGIPSFRYGMIRVSEELLDDFLGRREGPRTWEVMAERRWKWARFLRRVGL